MIYTPNERHLQKLLSLLRIRACTVNYDNINVNKLKSKIPNKDLLVLLRDGDPIAFHRIYHRYCKRLYGFVLRYVKQEEEAEGIVQEVFLKIWESRSKIDVYASFEAFLFTVAYNQTISLLRKKVNEKKYLEHLRSRSKFKQAPGIIEEVHFRELTEKVKSLLGDLTPRQQEIFILSRQQGLKHTEIAKQLGISVNTVKNHLVAALSYLRSRIDQDTMLHLFF